MASTDAGLSSLALATYSTNTYYSTYFDGSTGALNIPNNAVFNLGATDFTVEAWVYRTGGGGRTAQNVLNQSVTAASSNSSFYFGAGSDGCSLYLSTSGTAWTNNIETATAPATNTWTHIAWQRRSNVLQIYLNGVLQTVASGTAAFSGTVFSSTRIIEVGTQSAAGYFTGYISNLRLVKGSSVYTGAFDPPTIQLTAITNTALLTCQTNGVASLVDNSVNNATITRIGNIGFKQFTPLLQSNASVTLSPTFTTGTVSYTYNASSNIAAISVTPTAVDPALATIKYNGNVTLTSGQANIAASGPYFTKGYSAYFTAGLFQNANSIQNNTQGYSWTAEMWVYPNGNYTAINTLFSKRTNGTTVTAYEGYLTSTNGYISFFNGTAYTSTYTLITNTWSHVAYTYDGNQVTIYVNGNKVYGVVATVTDVAATPLTIGGKLGYTEMMIGNISNFRFVKGYQIYTQKFTPPTQPLDLVQSSDTGIRAIGNGVMPTGGYSVRTTAAYNTYLTVASNAAFNLSSGDFTVEFYINPLSITQTAVWLINWNGDPRLQLDNATLVWYTTGVARITSGSVLAINKWTHIALVRLSGTTKMYADGVQTGSSYSDANTYTQQPVDIGYKGASGYFGYLSNIRIVKGTAVYTTTFTPPTSPLTAITNTGLLIYQTSFKTDASTNNFTVTPTYTGSATPDSSIQLATNFGPFSSTLTSVTGVLQTNGNSVFFTNTNVGGDVLIVSNSVSLGTSDFTIELWLYTTSRPVTYPQPISNATSFAANGWFLFEGRSDVPANATKLQFWAYNISSSAAVFISNSSLSLSTWYHVALVRTGTLIKLYINGVLDSTSAATVASIDGGTTTPIYFANGYNGYLSNARIAKTAIYTANFSTPTTPLVATTSASVQLLALQTTIAKDASTNNFTVTVSTGSPTLSTTVSPFIISGLNGAGSTELSSASVKYLTVSNPYVPALSLGQGHNDFTAEAWVYLTATPPVAPGWYIMQKGINSTPGLEWSFSVTSTGLYFQTTSGIPTGTTTSTAFSANIIPGQWMHLALTKVGTSIHFWFNGIYTGTVNGVNNLFYTANVASYITIANTQTGATTAFSGFISNARVVYGKALYTVDYTAGFTPSTTPLNPTQSATSSIASIDNASSYTVVNGSSVYFNNTNDFLTFPEPASNFYSAQFNGTSQYLSATAGSTQFALSGSSFTIETWVYLTSYSAGGSGIISNTDTNANNGFYFYFAGTSSANSSFGFNAKSGGSFTVQIGAGYSLSLNTWYHLALSKIGSSYNLFANGSLITTQTSTSTWTDQSTLYIGAIIPTTGWFPGYISNLRLINGTGLYSSSFTPSTIPLTRTSQGATSSQVSLLTLQNNTIIDNSTNAFTINNQGSTTTSQNHPFTTYGDGTNVTFEAWVMLGAAPTTRGWIINNSATTTGYFGVAIESTRYITVWSDSNVTAVLTTSNNTTIPLYTWTHIAVVYVNQLINVYINGVRDGTTIGKTTVWQAATLGTVYIGRQASAAAQYFPGYITNVRMVYGTAIYTGKFSVPTSPLTAINGTVFLGLQSSVTFDASTNNATITKGSGATGLILSPLTSPFTTYLPTVTNGSSLALSWGQASSTNSIYAYAGYATAFELPGDFTMECWLYMSSISSTAGLFDNRGALTDAGYAWYVYSNGTTAFFSSNAAVVTSTTSLIINTWYHLAITRQNGTMKIWINGIQDASVTNITTDYGRTYNYMYLNSGINSGAILGYVSNARLIIGTAIYTGTFTPSVTPYSLTSPSSTNTLAVNGVTTYPGLGYVNANGGINPNGVNYSGSYYFGGGTASSQQINLANSGNAGRFEIGIYDFTIEAWFNCTATTAGNYTIVSAGNATAGYTDYAWSVYVYKTSATAGILGFQSYIGTSSFNPTYTGTINSNQWYHMAIVRIGTSFNMYLNGVSVATSTIFNTPAYVPLGSQLPASTIAIGALYSTAPYTNSFYGYISNVRVMKGYGVYTGTFTPPTVALSNTQGTGSFNISAITGTSTSLLALQNATTNDASTNNFTLTATGSPTLSSTVFPAFAVTNGYSGYFNGGTAVSVNGGLTGALNGLTTGTTGDWTVECWVYMTGTGPTGTDYSGAYDICGTSDVRTSIGFIIGITNVGYLLMARGGGYVNVNNTIPAMNTWAHLAFVNVGTTMNIYLNGTALSNTVSLTGTWAPSAYTLTSYVGSSGYGSFTGYISNFRAVGGVAVYTGNFTVPTSPLTATQSAGTNISAITAGQTKLLVLQNSLYTDASSSNYTLTTIQQSSYYSSLSTTITPFAATNGYSVGFTGSTQYLNAPSNAAFTFNTTDFTIEGWIYLSSGTSGTLYDSRTGATTVSPQIYIASNIINYAVAGVSVITGTTASLATWYHIAVVRISNVTKLYINGTQSGNSYTDNNNYVIGSPYIGTGYNTSNPLAGYISNLRVVKGTGVYTNTFTTPTSTLTSTQSSSGSIIALGNATPALGNSVYFNGTVDYMKAPSSVSFMGTGDFTIETYYYPTSFAAITTILGQYTAATTGLGYWNIQVTTAGIITVYYNGSTNFTASTAILINEWVHIALVRVSGTITLYVNGVSYGSVSYALQFGLTNIASVLHIGVTQSAATYAVGYMSNLRIVKGLGVYTGAFTVPTSPLGATQSSSTNIAAITGTSTSLLLYQNSPYTDNSTYNNTVTPFGSLLYSPVFSPSFFSYPTPANGNSGYFNGTSAYLSLTQPSNAGTSDFTIEMWIYPTSLAAIGYLLSTSTTAANCYHMWVTTGGLIYFAVDSATVSVSSTQIAKINTWTHVAVTRPSGSLGTIYMFINGIKQASTFNKTTQFGDTGVLNVGRYQPTPGQYFTGYITNLRFVYGYGLYSGTSIYFVPNYSTPLTAITGTTLLLLQSTLTKDNSTNNVTVTNNNVILSTYTNPYTMLRLPALLTAQNSRDATITTGFRDNSMYNGTLTSGSLSYASHQPTVSPFGVTPAILFAQTTATNDNSINNYSVAIGQNNPVIMPYVSPFMGNAIAFNGSTQYITGTSLYNSLGGDFTIEFFMKAGPQTASVTSILLCKNAAFATATNNNYYIGLGSPGGVKTSLQTLQIYNTVSTGYMTFAGTTVVCDSKWHHVAIVRINNIITVYIDGVADTGTLGTTNKFFNNTTWDYSSYAIGSNPNDGGATVAQLAYNGMLSNLRIINGTGIYTGTFTPPTNTLTKSQSSGTNIVAYTPSVPPNANSYSLSFRGVEGTTLYTSYSGASNPLNADYTIEFWHYLTGKPSGSTNPALFSNGSMTTGGITMFAGHSSGTVTKYQISFNGGTSSLSWLESTNNTVYGKWTHIALVRISGTMYFYINGVLDSSTTLANYTVFSPETPSSSYLGAWQLGGSLGSTGTYISGFISNFRVVRGIGVYTGNFTVPTSALTLTQSSGTNIASIPGSTIYTNGNATIFGPAGYQSLATSPYLLSIGSSDFTVEAWVLFYIMPTVDTWATGCSVLLSGDSSITTGIQFVIGKSQLFVVITNTLYSGNATHNMVTGNWYHVAYARISNNIYFYVNGVRVGIAYGASAPITSITTTYIGTAAANSSYGFNGYISNLRFIKGLGAYTNAFTPSTTPLSMIQNAGSTNITAITGTSTSLLALQNSLTTDASTNNLTLSYSQNTTLSIFSPFAATNGYSGYFNGVTGAGASYMQAVTSITSQTVGGLNALSSGSTGDYTIECWVYQMGTPAGAAYTNSYTLCASTNGSSTFYCSYIAITVSGYLFYTRDAATAINVTATTPTLNAWTHLAFVNVGTTMYIYVNGVQQANTGSLTGTWSTTGTYSTIGGLAGNYAFNGYISNFRAVANIALYTGNFTVPTTPLSITQSSSTNINPLSAPISTYAGYFNAYTGTQYITAPSNATFAFGTGNFTIECWFYSHSISSSQPLIEMAIQSTANNSCFELQISSSVLRFISNGTAYITGTTTLWSYTWYHVMVTRSSTTTIQMFLNGVQEGPTYTASATQNFTNSQPRIGYGLLSAGYMYGYISNVRLINGQALATGKFVVSSSTLTSTTVGHTGSGVAGSITGTVSLLTLQNSTIIDNGNGNSGSGFTLTNGSTGTPTPTTNSTVTMSLLEILPSVRTQLLLLQNSVSSDASVNNYFFTPSKISMSASVTPFAVTNGNSASFAGSAITAPSNAVFTFGTGDFTIEGWIYISVGSSGTLFDGRTSINSVHPVLYVTSSIVKYRVAGSDVISGSTLNNSTWYHIAVVRISSSTKLYINGVQSGSTYSDSNNYLICGPSIGIGYQSNNPLIGYISNLRIVKGTGVYTTTFAPSIVPLTSTQSASTGKVAVSVIPYNGSIYYPGSAYQSIPANALYSFGTNDFTIEAYIYMTTYSSGSAVILQSSSFTDTTSTDKWQLYVQGNINGLNFTTLASGLQCDAIFPNPWSVYKWYHIAVVRKSGVITLYVNGVAGTRLNNVGNANNYVLTQNGITIGGGSSGNYFTGLISNIRLIKTAIYSGTNTSTANFTVPTAPLSNYQNASTNIAGITNPTTAITNGSSVLFNGTTDYLRIANYSALNFGSNNYTIELWFYTTTTTTTQMILSKVSNKTLYDFYLKLNADDGTGGGAGQLEFYQGNIGTGKTLMGIIFPNTWYHVTVYRYSGTTYYMYVNGVNAFVGGYLLTSTNPAYDSTNDLNVGVDGVDYNSKFFSGYITNLRITNGVGIYYNFPGNIFNPPQAPLTTAQLLLPGMGAYASTSTQTAFLGLQTNATTDSSVNNATITAYGTPTVSTSVRPFTLGTNLGYSLYFNGSQPSASGSNITGYVDLFNNSNTWTIELWYYLGNTSNTYATLVDANYSNANDICIRVDMTKVYYTVCTSANSQINVITSSTNTVSGWNHVALVKGMGIITLYLNGANAGTAGSTWSATGRNGASGLGYNTSFGQPFVGYMSNFRIVKDVAVYTSPFTVPTSPFTNPQIIPSTISAITSGQTSLLVLQNSTTTDNSGNSLTLTATGTPTLSSTIVPSFPGAIVANGYSAFFAGSTTGYLNVNSGTGGLSALTSGTTGDYTIECWVYMTVAPTGTTVVTSSIICANTNGGTSIWFVIAVTTTGYIFYDRAGGGVVNVTGTTPTLNTWTHLAFVNVGTTMNIYLNGTKLANTGSLTGTWSTSATYTTLGCYASNQGGFFNGYITNFRAVGGVAVYTGNFTVPTSPLTATQSSGTNITAITSGQTKLLMLQTTTVTADTGTSTYTFNNGGGVSSSTQTPFVSTYGYSVNFTGSTQYLSAPSNAVFTFGTGDFTIEGWIYLTSGTTGTLFDNRTGASTVSPQIYITGSIIYYAVAGTNRITGPTISTSTWYHIAVSRVSGVTTMYVNGFLFGSAYTDSNSYVIGSPYIGTGFGTSNALVGYISNLRVVKGLGVYTTGFFTPTSPLSATQSVGPNTTVNAYTLILQSGQTDAATGTTAPTFSAQTTFGGAPLMSPFYLPSATTSLLMAQGNPINSITAGGSIVQPIQRDNSIFNIQTITTGAGSPVLDKGTSPFIQSTSLLAVQSYGVYPDNGPSGWTWSGAGAIGVYSTAVSPFNTVPTVMLVAQSNNISNTGFSASADQANVNYVQYGANAAASTVNGPFNSDTPLLTLQNALVIDNSNNRSQMTVVGGGVSPTDSSPFTPSKSLTSLLTAQSTTSVTVDNSYSVAPITATNTPVANNTYSPFFIPSSTIAVLGLQSNILTATTGDNWGMITSGTAPTSNTNSPFGTYYANGILTLNTNSTTGIYGSNIINYANLLVTAGDGVTTNAYSITINSLNNVGNIGNRTIMDSGLLPAQSNANVSLVDLGNTNVGEATILTFANTSITPSLNVIDYGYATAPSNTTFIITDVANSNLGETLNSIFVSNVSAIIIPTDSGLGQVAPSNTTFFISDVANSNISETIANVTISDVSTTRSIADTGTQPPPSPVGGTVLFPTYAYTDGITITAANVQGGGTSGTTASNQQIWYQT